MSYEFKSTSYEFKSTSYELLSSRHHAMNLVQFTITAINLDLPLDFYGSVCRKYFEDMFSSSFQQLMLVQLKHS